MKQEAQVHRLPTEEIIKNHAVKHFKEGYLLVVNDTYIGKVVSKQIQMQHLYITVSQEPNMGEWCYSTRGIVGKFGEFENSYANECRKIIATTDKKLIYKECEFGFCKKGCLDRYANCTERKVMSQIQQSFIKEYCDKGGIDKVLVEYELDVELGVKNIESKGKISPWKLKLNSDNTIIITPLEEKMYSREEELLSAICQFTERNTQSEILEVQNWLRTKYKK